MGLPGMVLSAVSTVVGAVMYWAITAPSSAVAQQHGFRLSTVGIILMIAGVLGFIVSLVVFMSSRRAPSAAPHSIDREVVDSSGHRSEMHERQS
jgi:phosphate/sulfate permease